MDLRFGQLADVGLGHEALRDRLGLDALGVETAPVVGDLNNDVAAFMIGGQPDPSALRLAGGLPLLRRLQPVVGGIAHHMGQRILDEIEHLAVELGLGALHFQIDLLAELVAEIAHDARKFLPRIADRLHARLHHAFLQLGGDIREALQRPLEFGIFVTAHDLQKLIAGEHQLGNHRHQMFERIDCDADRLSAGFCRYRRHRAAAGASAARV